MSQQNLTRSVLSKMKDLLSEEHEERKRLSHELVRVQEEFNACRARIGLAEMSHTKLKEYLASLEKEIK